MRPSRDHHLPPDPDAYRHAAHPKGRIIVIAPTRAACETIELALACTSTRCSSASTARRSASSPRSGRGFGIVAGTGTGKTLGIRPIAEAILRDAASGRRGEPGAGGDARDARPGTS